MSLEKQDDFWIKNRNGMEYWCDSTLAIRIMKTAMSSVTFPNLYYAIVYFPLDYRIKCSQPDYKENKAILSMERTILDRSFYNMQMRAFVLAKELGWDIKNINLFKEEDL
tara:strand:- start:200 stop:529 length:330 start_codon:yes stop_codon:yes gene_type:complete